MRRTPEELVGKTFGRWKVTSIETQASGSSRAKVWCKCECGTTRSVATRALVSGGSKSCGCLQIEQLAIRSRDPKIRRKVDRPVCCIKCHKVCLIRNLSSHLLACIERPTDITAAAWNARKRRHRKKEEVAEYARNWRRKDAYGVSKEWVNEKLQSQANKCAVCSLEFEKDWLGRSFHIDHNHSTGAVRGLLCNNCNWALGNAKEDLNILKKLILYLEEYNAIL